MKRGFRRPAAVPGWVWPLTAVVVTVVLATFGRYLVAGMFTVMAVGFLLTVTSAIVLVLVSMAMPGPRGALHEVPHSWREARASVATGWSTMIHRVGQAPWRAPKRVAELVSHQLLDEVFDLPSGSVAYSDLRIRLHPRTLSALDQWMPIEQIALIWATEYADLHRDTRGQDQTVSVSVVGSEEVPPGRAVIQGAFRAAPDDEDAWARVTCTRVAHDGAVSLVGPGDIVRLPAAGRDHVAGVLDHDATTRLDPHATMGIAATGNPRPDPEVTTRHPAAGVRPARALVVEPPWVDGTQILPQAHLAPERSAGKADATARPDPESTLLAARTAARRVRAETTDGPGAPMTVRIPVRRSLGLQRVDPVTKRRLGDGPVLFDLPRVRVGRDPSMDLTVDDALASREHAELRRVDDAWTIADSNSTHGTAVNDTWLTPGERRTIRDGDTLRFGPRSRSRTVAYMVVLSEAPAEPCDRRSHA